MKNQDNLKIDVRKFPSFSNGMKKIYTIFVTAVLFLIIPSISSAATVTTFANLGFASGVGALLSDTAGNFYTVSVSRSSDRSVINTIKKITPTGVVTTFATFQDPGVSYTSGMAFNTSGDLYVGFTNAPIDPADNNANSPSRRPIIRKITPSGTVTTFATLPPSGAKFKMVFGPSGNLYVFKDAYNESGMLTFPIEKITPAGVVTTLALATAPRAGGLGDVGGMVSDTSGNIYVGELNTKTISKITPSGTVTIVASISSPYALNIDSSDNVYVVSYELGIPYNLNRKPLFKITPSGTVTTFATLNTGVITNMVFDPSGNLYTADINAATISKITPSGTVTTIASLGTYAQPQSLIFDTAGNLYTLNANSFKSPYTISKISSSISVSSNVAASWTITGPATITGSGTSQTTLGKPSGTYTITWGAVSGYVTPATQSLTLDWLGDISFSGTYLVPCVPSPQCIKIPSDYSGCNNSNCGEKGTASCINSCDGSSMPCGSISCDPVTCSNAACADKNWREVAP